MGSQKSMNAPIWITVGFQQRDKQASQNLDEDNFCRLPVAIAQCVIGTEEYPVDGISMIHDVMIILRVMVKLNKFIEL